MKLISLILALVCFRLALGLLNRAAHLPDGFSLPPEPDYPLCVHTNCATL